jgi:hypothetical protein
MKTLDVDCPRCGCGCDLQLEDDTNVVLLSCPSCSTPLVSYYGQTFQVEPSEFRYLRQRGGMREATGAVRVRQGAGVGTMQQAVLAPAVHAAGDPLLDHPVGADEILELHDELAACESIEDVLRFLG